MLFEEATSTHDAPYTRILVEIVKNTTGTVHTLLAGDVCIFSANRRWNDVSGANSHKLHTNGICLAHTPLARPGYATSGNRSKHHYADIFLTFPVPPPDSHTPQGTSYGESQYPSENRIDTVKSFSNMQSELRASAAEFPFGLRSPAALRVSPGLLLSSFGAMLLLSSSFVALCVLICLDPSVRCCASLLVRRRPSFSLCVEAALVCVAGGRRRHEIRRQDRHPAPLLWLSGDSGLCCLLLLIGISKSVVLLGLRLRSPPVASGQRSTRALRPLFPVAVPVECPYNFCDVDAECPCLSVAVPNGCPCRSSAGAR